jgi:hypothetical protein
MSSIILPLKSVDAEESTPMEIDALEVVLATADSDRRQPRSSPASCGNPVGFVVARLADVDEDGQPIVCWTADDDTHRERARTIVPVHRGCIGVEVALAFPSGNSQQPLVIGILQPPRTTPASEAPPPLEARVDNQRLELTADREIVLRCGKASITLTRAGKVLIRGAYVLSRSSGVNRIKGASVQIN